MLTIVTENKNCGNIHMPSITIVQRLPSERKKEENYSIVPEYMRCSENHTT